MASRQISGGGQVLVTSALVGVAGSFIGYHLAIMLRLGTGLPQLLGAAVGALVVLFLWRMVPRNADNDGAAKAAPLTSSPFKP